MIAIDWGTTSFRAYRLDEGGRIIDSRSAPAGILTIENGKFATVLEQQVGEWIDAGETQVVMSGMIGSRQGWMEVPYADCPAGLDEIAAGMRSVAWSRGEAWIAPGVACHEETGVPDVIRGEETQILGCLDRLGSGRHTICLPGTHSKWVEVDNGRIMHFSTHMTGEAFAVQITSAKRLQTACAGQPKRAGCCTTSLECAPGASSAICRTRTRPPTYPVC
jgi:2-dehydro-3-deoxygalactonokinase